MILLAATGESNAAIARRLCCEVKTVRKWRGRFAARPTTEALKDGMRVGRPATITKVARLELVKLACKRAADCKAPFREVWTGNSLRIALERATGFKMSTSEVRRTLNDEELRPHRFRLWLHSPDPNFASKVRRICSLYMTKPTHEHMILCIDEKTGMQVLEHKHPLRAPRPRRPGRFEFEYIRRGTRTLFAAFNPHNGEVFGRCSRRRRASDLLRSMEDVAVRFPHKRITVVWDNLNIHAVSKWQAFNERDGSRFSFVYTPIHASWVNQIEIWFSILARRVLRYGSFSSASDLTAAVRRLAQYESLEHLRARKRADLITLESGPQDDVVPHTRLRRVGVQKWQIEMPLRGGGWDRTPLRGQLTEQLDLVITQFPWMLAPRH
jgi:transposase